MWGWNDAVVRRGMATSSTAVRLSPSGPRFGDPEEWRTGGGPDRRLLPAVDEYALAR
jgi:hypothetical protein